MSPRVRPKTQEYADHLDERARIAEAAAEYDLRKNEIRDETLRKHGLPSSSVRSNNGAYGPGSGYSWFADFCYGTTNRRLLEAFVFAPLVGSVEEARARLLTVELRDISTTAGAGGSFVPTGSPPSYVADAFAASARASSVMATVLPVEPLPDTGMALKTPRLTTGVATVVQASENTAVQETDVVEALVSSPVALIAGQQDLSQQLFDRSDPSMVDVVLARELGRSLGQSFDAQVIAGTGLNGQTLGLRAVSGIIANSYTDATSTQAEAFPLVNKTYSDIAVALGQSPTVIVMHPRRSAWFTNWKDTATGMQSNLNWPATVVEAPAIGTTYGTSTNEDEIYVLRADELPIYLADPVFRVSFNSGSGTLTVRLQATQYVSTLFGRRPEAIGKIGGTGLIPPVFT